MCLVIGPRTFKAWQKGVKDIDAFSRELGDKLGRENLHATGQHSQFGALGLDEVLKGAPLMRFASRSNWQMVKRHAMPSKKPA